MFYICRKKSGIEDLKMNSHKMIGYQSPRDAYKLAEVVPPQKIEFYTSKLQAAVQQVYDNERHWVRPFMRGYFNYTGQGDKFVDDELVLPIVHFFERWLPYSRKLTSAKLVAKVIFAIRDQPWNLSLPNDILDYFNIFWRSSTSKKFKMYQNLMKKGSFDKAFDDYVVPLAETYMKYYKEQQ